MSIIVRDDGFHDDDLSVSFAALADLPEPGAARALELQPADKIASLSNRLGGIEVIAIRFPAFSDGRGFTLAKHLREMGFAGRLRAVGAVLPDQYAMARRNGFDEVEISDELAQRTGEVAWTARANWRSHDYQARLRA
jgi:uncharacterized protein (DUF934 family)